MDIKGFTVYVPLETIIPEKDFNNPSLKRSLVKLFYIYFRQELRPLVNYEGEIRKLLDYKDFANLLYNGTYIFTEWANSKANTMS